MPCTPFGFEAKHTCSRNDVSKPLPLPRRIEPLQALMAAAAGEGCTPASQPLYGSICASQRSPCSPECFLLQACEHGTCFSVGARAGVVGEGGNRATSRSCQPTGCRNKSFSHNVSPCVAGRCSCSPPQQRRSRSLRPCPLLPAERGSAVAPVRAVLSAGSRRIGWRSVLHMACTSRSQDVM